MTAATLIGLASAALVGLGLYGVITNPPPLRNILAFTLVGSGVFAENRASDGNGANITFNVGGNVLMEGPSGTLAGAVVSSSKLNGGNPAHAGDTDRNHEQRGNDDG